MSQAYEPVPLPFTRAVHDLPADLPTTSEIRASQTVLADRRLREKVVAPTPDFVVKFGSSTREREGQTLLFLEKYAPQVPAPRLYAMYREDGDLFIIMQRFPGIQLDEIWDDLSALEKNLITAQLRKIFCDMRSVPCPSAPFFGSVDGGPVPHHLFYSHIADRTVTGPFYDEKQFNGGLIVNYRQLREMNNVQDFKNNFYAQHLDEVLCEHKPTLTHCDLQRKNIMVCPKSTNSLHREFEVSLVDWEDAGWYPEYWEYFVAFTGFGLWDNDWCQQIEKVITAWPKETAIMMMIYRELFL